MSLAVTHKRDHSILSLAQAGESGKRAFLVGNILKVFQPQFASDITIYIVKIDKKKIYL